MNKRILISLILSMFSITSGIVFGMHAPGKENKLNPDSSEKHDSAPTKRSTPLRGTFSRRPKRLEALADSKSPNSKKALYEEARRLTPFFTLMYAAQYDTSDPLNPSPTKEADHKKRKKNKEKAKELTRKKVRTARELFADEEENWSNTADIDTTYRVNQNDEIINPFHVDEDGRLNLHRMLNGRAPIGPDGRSVNLHHWLREDPAPEGELVLLGELTREIHTRESGVLHFPSEGIRDRTRFNNFRELYWQGRAMDIVESRLFR